MPDVQRTEDEGRLTLEQALDRAHIECFSMTHPRIWWPSTLEQLYSPAVLRTIRMLDGMDAEINAGNADVIALSRGMRNA